MDWRNSYPARSLGTLLNTLCLKLSIWETDQWLNLYPNNNVVHYTTCLRRAPLRSAPVKNPPAFRAVWYLPYNRSPALINRIADFGIYSYSLAGDFALPAPIAHAVKAFQGRPKTFTSLVPRAQSDRCITIQGSVPATPKNPMAMSWRPRQLIWHLRNLMIA